jgi:hypothetical protein
MKVKWIIARLDGAETIVVSEVDKLPRPGDGAIVERINVRVNETVTTPVSAEITKIDAAITATELKL